MSVFGDNAPPPELTDELWLLRLASIVLTAPPDETWKYIGQRLHRIGMVLENRTETKKQEHLPKCQWCGEQMHKSICPRISAVEHLIDKPGESGWRRVEFFDQRPTTLKMSSESIAPTKEQA